MDMAATERIQREHIFIYNEEMPPGWQRGNLLFVRDPEAPGGVRHDIFIYDPKVECEDRRENGEDARWIEGRLSCRQRVVIEHEWEELDVDEYIDATGLFREYRTS